MKTGNTAENTLQYHNSVGRGVVNPTAGSIHYLIAEATQFSSEIQRLSAELTDAKQRIAVQDEEIAQLQDQVHQQGVQLKEAAGIMTEQYNRITELEDAKQSLEECGKMLAFERRNTIDAEEKLQKMKESIKAVAVGELHQFMGGIRENIQEDWSFLEKSMSSVPPQRPWHEQQRKNVVKSKIPTNSRPATAAVVNPPQRPKNPTPTAQLEIKKEIPSPSKNGHGNEFHGKDSTDGWDDYEFHDRRNYFRSIYDRGEGDYEFHDITLIEAMAVVKAGTTATCFTPLPPYSNDTDENDKEEEVQWDVEEEKVEEERLNKEEDIVCDRIMDQKLACDHCSMRFTNTTYLKQHMIQKHNKMSTVFCNGLHPIHRRHFSPSKSDKRFLCDCCCSSFAGLNKLLRHKKRAHGIDHKGFEIGCRDCGLIYKTRKEHSQHRIIVHHSAIGRRKRKPANREYDALMLKLKKEEGRWVLASAAAIASDYEDRVAPAASVNEDKEEPSEPTGDLHGYDKEDNENMDV